MRRQAVAAVRQVGDRVLLGPIRRGRPEIRLWPDGLVPVVLLALAAMVVCAVLVLFADQTRSLGTPVMLEVSVVGGWSITILLWILIFAIALALTGALHLHPLVRVPLLLALFGTILQAQIAGDAGLPLWQTLVAVGAFLALIIFVLVRGRRPFAWFEFPIILALVMAAIYLRMGSGVIGGIDFRSLTLISVLTQGTLLAIPSLMVTGYTAGQVTVSLARWGADGVADTLPRRALAAVALLLTAVVLAVAVVRTGQHHPGWEGGRWLASTAALGGCALCFWLVRRGLRAVHADRVPTPDALDQGWTALVYPFAVIVSLSVLLTVPITMIYFLVTLFLQLPVDGLLTFISSTWLVTAQRVLAAVVALVLAVQRTRRGDAAASGVLVCFAVLIAFDAAGRATNGLTWVDWNADICGVLLVAAALILAAGGVLLPRWHVRWESMLVVAALTAIYRFREVLTEPSVLFLGISGSVALLLTLVWRLLTDGEWAHGHSRAFPRPGRVVLIVTSILLSAITLAWSSQTRVTELDPAQFIQVGDQTLGTPLMLAAGLWALSTVLTRIDPGDSERD